MSIIKWITIIVLVLYELFVLFVSRKEKTECSGSKLFFAERLFFVGSFFSRYLFAGCLRRVTRKKEQVLIELYEGNELSVIKSNLLFSKITYIMLMLPPACGIGAVFCSKKLLLLFLLLIVFLVVYPDVVIAQKLNKRREEIMNAYPGVLTKTSILINAGIPLIEAFDRVSNSGKSILYLEMSNCIDAINNGISYEAAFDKFAKKCGCREVRRFAALCNQNIFNGDADLVFLLSEISNSAWEERKMRAKLASERASELLLLPIILMFSGVMIMVIVPAFQNLF